MIQNQLAIVKQFPAHLDAVEGRGFFRELRAELKDCYRPRVVFDLSRVEHMRAQGLDLMVRCIDEIADQDGELKFAAASPETELVLELTQISGVAESYDSVEDALESWTLPTHKAALQLEPAAVSKAA